MTKFIIIIFSCAYKKKGTWDHSQVIERTSAKLILTEAAFDRYVRVNLQGKCQF